MWQTLKEELAESQQKMHAAKTKAKVNQASAGQRDTVKELQGQVCFLVCVCVVFGSFFFFFLLYRAVRG